MCPGPHCGFGLAFAAGFALFFAAMAVPAPAGALSGEESLDYGRTYYRVYDMKAGDILTWEWRAVTPGGNLSCALLRKGRT